MSNSLPKVTFGIVNCNRLFYLKSCIESLLYCTEDYENKELIIIDNASIEEGTEKYLDEKEKQGHKVLRTTSRDPSNEYAKGLNTIVRESTGDFICLLEGDMQFIVKGGWLKDYVTFFKENYDKVGCISFDAQRTVRNKSGTYSGLLGDSSFKFIFDFSRSPLSGAGEVMYSRKMIDLMYPWSESNRNHEGGEDSETKMLRKISNIIQENKFSLNMLLPVHPVSIQIYTDKRGTNARIRGNKRYGEYWSPKDDFKYYEIMDYEGTFSKIQNQKMPIGIEYVAKSIGWDPPVDAYGNWKKNPIRPETASRSDYIILGQEEKDSSMESDQPYVNMWLDGQ